MNNIQVTAVMITGLSGREKHRNIAIQSFLNQTYQNAELLIITDGEPVSINHPRIRVLTAPKVSLGALRNFALGHINTPYIVQWDDDDYSRADRIEWQLSQMGDNEATMFRRQLCYDFVTKQTTYKDARQRNWGGFAGTIMHKYSDKRYPDKSKSEDSDFICQFQCKVLNNDANMYIRTYIGANTWDQNHVTWSDADNLIEPQPEEVTKMLRYYNETILV